MSSLHENSSYQYYRDSVCVSPLPDWIPMHRCAGTDYKILWRYRCDLLATITLRFTRKSLMLTYVNKEGIKTWWSHKGKGLLHIILSKCSPADDVLFSTFAAFHLKKKNGDPGFLRFVPVLMLLLQTLLISWHLVGEHLQKSSWSTYSR